MNVPDSIGLKINADGLPLSKSSNVECWPILVEIAETKGISPEVVGIYCGNGKPKDHESYLRQFVNELKDCLLNGINFNGCLLAVRLVAFILDSPARAALKSKFSIYIQKISADKTKIIFVLLKTR